MSRTTNVRASVVQTANGAVARKGHVRRLPDYVGKSYRQGMRNMSNQALYGLIDDSLDSTSLAGAAFEIARQESMASSPPVRYSPHIIPGDEDGTWIDAANSDWDEIPANSEHAVMRRIYAKDAVTRLMTELEREVTVGDKTVKELGSIATPKEQLANQIAEDLWDKYTTNDLGRALPPEVIREHKAEVRDAVLGALDVIGGDIDMGRELRRLHEISLKDRGHIPMAELDASPLIERVAEKSHVGWKVRRGRWEVAPRAPEVYEDENGRLVNVNDPDEYVPLSVMEQVREKTQRELGTAMGVVSNSSSLFKRKVDQQIAREFYINDTIPSDDAFNHDRRDSIGQDFDTFSSEEQKPYIARAKARRQQVKQFGIREESTIPAPGPRYL